MRNQIILFRSVRIQNLGYIAFIFIKPQLCCVRFYSTLTALWLNLPVSLVKVCHFIQQFGSLVWNEGEIFEIGGIFVGNGVEIAELCLNGVRAQ